MHSLQVRLERADDSDFEGVNLEINDALFFPPDDVSDADLELSYEQFHLPIIYDPRRNVLEESVNFHIAAGTMIANKYRIVDYLGSGVFSRAVQCVELETGKMVCVKIIRNNKDFFDQSLGEVRFTPGGS